METRKLTRSGAKLLREMYGKDWHTKINLDKLDMSNPQQCILGQLYGDYDWGLNEVNLDHVEKANERILKGFTIDDSLSRSSWDRLTEGWIRQIMEYYRKR